MVYIFIEALPENIAALWLASQARIIAILRAANLAVQLFAELICLANTLNSYPCIY